MNLSHKKMADRTAEERLKLMEKLIPQYEETWGLPRKGAVLKAFQNVKGDEVMSLKEAEEALG